LIVKSTFKSHFKIKKNLCKDSKNLEKKIFVKNMFIFLLFSKIFLKNCVVSFFFKTIKKNKTNILKAPSRHKKFFHQIYFEFFQIKFFFRFFLKKSLNIKSTTILFNKFNLFLNKVGSNILTRVKITISTQTNFNYII
jgi:hypothetical protein